MSGDRTLGILLSAPVFLSLPDHLAQTLADASQLVEFTKDSTVCNAGGAAESVFVVGSGVLEVWGSEPFGVVRRLGPGDLFGELAVLLREPRSATVTAARTAVLVEIPAASFLEVLNAHAELGARITRLIAQRLTTPVWTQPADALCRVIGIRADDGLIGSGLVVNALAVLHAINGDAPTLITRFAPGKGDELAVHDVRDANQADLTTRLRRSPASAHVQHLDAGDVGDGDDVRAAVDRVVELLGEQVGLVIVDAGTVSAIDDSTLASCCDTVVRVVREPGHVDADGARSVIPVHDVLNLANSDTARPSVNHREPVVLPDEPALHEASRDEQQRFVLENPWNPLVRNLGRLVRVIDRSTVGVALGGGAAFGIAHVGVLQVLADNDIPVDLVAGTSMGSIVGAGFAAGLHPDEMADIAVRTGGSFRTILSTLDVNPLRPGLLSSRRLREVFLPFLGEVRDFTQLVVPYRAVTTDIESGERITISQGDLADAFRASSSIPMLVTPARVDGRVLVDGAVVDPVPAEVVREMGGHVCLAVNVVPQLQVGTTTALSRAVGQVAKLNPITWLRGGSRGLPNALDLAMATVQTLQYELGDFKAVSADVRINCELADFTWIEFYRAAELIERGRQAAERALPAIQEVLAARRAGA